MMIGYARVSTDEQDLALLLDALRGAGCEEIFQDTASGANGGRKGLSDALARCAASDVLVVWKLDRLGRSLSALVGLVEALQGRNAGLKVLTGAGATIDTTRPEGRWVNGRPEEPSCFTGRRQPSLSGTSRMRREFSRPDL